MQALPRAGRSVGGAALLLALASFAACKQGEEARARRASVDRGGRGGTTGRDEPPPAGAASSVPLPQGPVFFFDGLSLGYEPRTPLSRRELRGRIEILQPVPKDYAPLVVLRCRGAEGTVWESARLEAEDRQPLHGRAVGATIELRPAPVWLGLTAAPELCAIELREGGVEPGATRTLLGEVCWRGEHVTQERCADNPWLLPDPVPGGGIQIGLRSRIDYRRLRVTVGIRSGQPPEDAREAFLVSACRIDGHVHVETVPVGLAEHAGSSIRVGDMVVHDMPVPSPRGKPTERAPSQCSLRVALDDGEVLREVCLPDGRIVDEACGVAPSAAAPVPPASDVLALRSADLEIEHSVKEDASHLVVRSEIELLKPVAESSTAVTVECTAGGETHRASHQNRFVRPHLLRPGERFTHHDYPFLRAKVGAPFETCKATFWGGPPEHTLSNRFSLGALCYERARPGGEVYRCD